MRFLEFFDGCLNTAPHLCLDIGYNSVVDWMVTIHDKASRKSPGDWGEPIIQVQDCDLDLACAEAHVELAKWMRENKGGY